jgi:hypothetical protein
MSNGLASAVMSVVVAVTGAVADMAEVVCDTSNDSSPTCEQVRELSTACDADDALPKRDDD